MKPLPSRKQAEDDALRLLQSVGIQPSDEFYRPLFRVLVAILYTTISHNALINDYGKELAALAAAPISKDQQEKLQWTAADLQQLKLSADWVSAMRLVMITAKMQRSRGKSNANLKRDPARVTREQAMAAMKRHRTQAAAAEALNISERRLRAIINGK